MNTNEKAPAMEENGKGAIASWFIVFGIAAFFLLWGLFIFSTVGDKGPPPWHFGVVQDIPGESPQANFGPQSVPGVGVLVPPQHVDDEPTKPFGLRRKRP